MCYNGFDNLIFMPRGGYRPGAGKPKGSKDAKTLEKEAYRAIFMEKMREKFSDVIDAQIELACGIAIIDKKDDTGERIFDRPPSAEAGKFLAEQTMGKAPQRVEMSGPDGGPIETVNAFDPKYKIIADEFEEKLRKSIIDS